MTGLLFKYILLPLALFAAGFGCAWRVHDWKDAAAVVKAQAHVVAVVQAQGSTNQAVAIAQQAAQDRTVTVTRTLTREIPVYVTPAADHRCDIPAGFVRVHDAAAANLPAVPFSAGQSADAPSGLALSDVADTVIANYGAANSCLAQLKGWQDWYAGQMTAWAAKAPR